MELTAYNLVSAIEQLPRNKRYQYVDKKNKGSIQILRIEGRDGPIIIKRYTPATKTRQASASEVAISPQMIWRIANAFSKTHVINFDRVLGGSYNTRSVLEALLAHTPEFYYCYPGRQEVILGKTQIKRGHKHLIWLPGQPHDRGALKGIDVQNMVISEVPGTDVVYDALTFPEAPQEGLNIEMQRRHAQIQIALLMIGKQLGYRSSVAQEDKGIVYRGEKLGEMDGVIGSLDEEPMLSHRGAVAAATHIDVIWLEDQAIPAVMEIEHSTGVTSGLTRMKKFQDTLPRRLPIRFVIVADEELRGKVIDEASKDIYKTMDIRFFPYSAVEELYALCQRRKLHGVTEDFLDCYMEQVRPHS